jgi:hypothetical protein
MAAQRPAPMEQVSTPWSKNLRPATGFEPEMSGFYEISNWWTSFPQWTDCSTMPAHSSFPGTKQTLASKVPLPLAQREDSLGSLFLNNLPSNDTDLPQHVGSSSETQSSTTLLQTPSMPNSSFQLQGMTTISPLKTWHDTEHIPPTSTTSFSSQPLADPAEEPNSSISEADRSTTPMQAQHGSPQDASEMAIVTTKKHRKGGRKRNLDSAEPGSARAIYLDKNRKAAKKCRSKQRQHEEDLVELARNVERKNKVLKVEAAILRDSKQGLLNMVAQHVDCPNSRIAVYLQREADRAAFEADSHARLHTQSTDSTSSPSDT